LDESEGTLLFSAARSLCWYWKETPEKALFFAHSVIFPLVFLPLPTFNQQRCLFPDDSIEHSPVFLGNPYTLPTPFTGGSHPMAKAAVKPLSKTEVFANIADATGLTKKQVGSVFDALNDQIKKAVSGRGPKSFTLPGLCKIVVQHKPATKERKGINPFTKEETVFKAKPARNVVKIRPLKKMKDMVS